MKGLELAERYFEEYGRPLRGGAFWGLTRTASRPAWWGRARSATGSTTSSRTTTIGAPDSACG